MVRLVANHLHLNCLRYYYIRSSQTKVISRVVSQYQHKYYLNEIHQM
jgi:hypothetical protein